MTHIRDEKRPKFLQFPQMQRKGNPRPLRYRQPAEKLRRPREELVKKGGNPLKGLSECLQTLKANSSTMIDQLPPNVSSCWDQVTMAMGMTEDTKFYEQLAGEIENTFQGVEPTPGTVGGYFAGCLADANKFPVPLGCTPTCLNAAAPSKSYMEQNNITPCQDLVLMASPEGSGYGFTNLNHESSAANAIIYVNGPLNSLTKAEKDSLQTKFPNLKNVTIINTANNKYETQVALTPLTNLPTRSPAMWEGIPSGSDPAINSPSMTWIIVGIIILFIVIILIWWYRSRKVPVA